MLLDYVVEFEQKKLDKGKAKKEKFKIAVRESTTQTDTESKEIALQIGDPDRRIRNIKPIKQNTRSPSKTRGSVSPEKQIGKSIDAAKERKVSRPAVKLNQKRDEPAITEVEE